MAFFFAITFIVFFYCDLESIGFLCFVNCPENDVEARDVARISILGGWKYLWMFWEKRSYFGINVLHVHLPVHTYPWKKMQFHVLSIELWQFKLHSMYVVEV